MIIVRIDLGSKYGLGHYSRVKTLIKYLKIKNYIIVTDNVLNSSFFLKEKKNLVSLYGEKNFFSEVNDAKLFLKKFKKYKNPIIIKDSYRLNYKWEKYLSNFSKKIISIDDFFENKHYSDFYINHHPALNENQRLQKIIKKNNKKGCKLLLGPNFTLFDSFIKKKKIIRSDLLFYNGGSGNILIYKKIIQNLVKLSGSKYKIILIVGPYSKNVSEVNKLFSKEKSIRIVSQPVNLISYIKNTKLFISPTSTSMFESSFTKTPSLLFRMNNHNQNLVSDKDLEKLGHYFSLYKKDLKKTDKIVNIIRLMMKDNKNITKLMMNNSIKLKKIKEEYSKNIKI